MQLHFPYRLQHLIAHFLGVQVFRISLAILSASWNEVLGVNTFIGDQTSHIENNLLSNLIVLFLITSFAEFTIV